MAQQSNQTIALITQRARQLGLDPRAVLAVAAQEGLGGGIGDSGHAFGPWQLNNAGGVITGKFQGQSPEQINQWAWSPQGIDYALGGIARVASGLTGAQAVNAIVNKFERPAAPGPEVSRALDVLGVPQSANGPASVPMTNTGTTSAGMTTTTVPMAPPDPFKNVRNALLGFAKSGDPSGLIAALAQTRKAKLR